VVPAGGLENAALKEVDVNRVMLLLKTPAGRALVGWVAFSYATVALGVGAPRAQTQTPQTTTTGMPADYRVGPGDRLFLAVPQRPDLNRELVIDPKGEVTLPLVGAVAVRGLTATEIQTRLLQALREYYPSVNRIEVTVTRASSNMIFVSGDVKLPGKYAFAETVNVWEAIREAGGPLPTATLSGVRVIQDRTRGGATFLVDVQAAIEKGSVDSLPILKPGDTVLVPGQEEAYTGMMGVNVIGAVLKPGVYRLQARQDLMSAILAAGGPSERANISDVRLIRPEPDGIAATTRIDVGKFLEKGDQSQNPKLLAGDTVSIGRKGFTAQDASLILGFVTAIGTLVLLYYTIQNEVTSTP
jgi:protein involved in polysaccharide export with SLBB domain